jgi:RND family efflux transporter MFP subunit
MNASYHRPDVTVGFPHFDVGPLLATVGFFAVVFAIASISNGQVIGFTEAYKQIELSSDEAGAISELYVEEGDAVIAGTVVAQLDSRVQNLQLEIATKMASTTSQLVAAEKTLEKRQSILKRLQTLKAKGHASDSEIIRAEMELSIAEAKSLSAKEDIAVRELEQRRAEVQLARRSIVAPFDGVVSKIHRRQGEFLSPVKPEVVTIVQVDRLLATFNVPSTQASMFEAGAQFTLTLASGGTVDATVERVGVETDAQSGTVEIKLVLDNADGKLRSGESVTLNI